MQQQLFGVAARATRPSRQLAPARPGHQRREPTLSTLSPSLSLSPLSLSSLHPRGEARPPSRNETQLDSQRTGTTSGRGTATRRGRDHGSLASRVTGIRPQSRGRRSWIFHYAPPSHSLQFHLTQRSLCATTGVTNLPPQGFSRVSSHPACCCMLRTSLALASVRSAERRG